MNNLSLTSSHTLSAGKKLMDEITANSLITLTLRSISINNKTKLKMCTDGLRYRTWAVRKHDETE